MLDVYSTASNDVISVSSVTIQNDRYVQAIPIRIRDSTSTSNQVMLTNITIDKVMSICIDNQHSDVSIDQLSFTNSMGLDSQSLSAPNYRSLTITNSQFVNVTGKTQSIMTLENSDTELSFINCTFVGPNATDGDEGDYDRVSAFSFVEASGVEFTNCTFDSFRMAKQGAVISLYSSTIEMIN